MFDGDALVGHALPGRGDVGGRLRFQILPVATGEGEDGVGVDVAGDAEDDVLRLVPGGDVVREVVACDGGDALQVAGDVPAEGLVAVGEVGQDP